MWKASDERLLRFWESAGRDWVSAEAMVPIGVSDISADLSLIDLAEAESGNRLAGECSNWVRMQVRVTGLKKCSVRKKRTPRLILSCGVGDRAAF